MEALALIEEQEFDAALLDIMMPKLDGLSVCRAVDTHIKRLREKLGEYAVCIKTVIKAG